VSLVVVWPAIIHTVYVSAGVYQITPHNYPMGWRKSHEI